VNISAAQLWMSSRKFTDDGVAVTYARGATSVVTTAVQGRTMWDAMADVGPIIRVETPDFFVKVSSIVALGEPRAGDTITEGARVFEVMAPTGGGAVWQWAHSPNRSVYRIHTKQVT